MHKVGLARQGIARSVQIWRRMEKNAIRKIFEEDAGLSWGNEKPCQTSLLQPSEKAYIPRSFLGFSLWYCSGCARFGAMILFIPFHYNAVTDPMRQTPDRVPNTRIGKGGLYGLMSTDIGRVAFGSCITLFELCGGKDVMRQHTYTTTNFHSVMIGR